MESGARHAERPSSLRGDGRGSAYRAAIHFFDFTETDQ
jgi:hypothetical protein